MSLDGTDLRDAFDPLAGDPVEDAARVLGALPKPGVPPIAWWLLAAGLIVGVVVGVCTGPWLFGGGGSEDDAPVLDKNEDPRQPTDPEKTQAPERKDGEKAQEKEKPKPPEDQWANIMFHGFDHRVVVRQNETSKEALLGEHMVTYGSTFETGAGQSGMLLAYEVQVRLDKNTVARVVEPELVVLREGQLWVQAGDIPDGVTVKTPLAVIDVQRGAANVDYRGGRLQVVCLTGRVAVDTGGRSLVLPPGTMGTVEDGEVDGPVEVPFVPSYTSWMTKMIVLQQDQSELGKRIEKVVDAYFGREHRGAARRELIRLGASIVPMLVDRYRNTPGLSAKFSREIARLVCQPAGQTTKKWVFDLLYDADPEVRVIAFTHAVRITHEDAGTGEAFWRNPDNAEERSKVIGEWWELVK